MIALLALINHSFIHSQAVIAKTNTSTPRFDSIHSSINTNNDTLLISKKESIDSSALIASNNINSCPNVRCKILSYDNCFSDSNYVQLDAAEKIGVKPMKNRKQVIKKVNEHKLTDISNSPYYYLEELTYSQPYLVPKAQQLLNTIGINFIDSLIHKGLKPHIPMVTSVLRVNEDIKKLQKGNINSVTKSCHQYGTTIDITYNRFMPIGNEEPTRYDDNMKKILAEVLFDLKDRGLCYVKYEHRQACFHLTAR